MKKIRLDLDMLSVDSFDTVARHDGDQGTVFGHRPPAYTYDMQCSEGPSCLDCDTGTGTGASDCGTCATACGTCATDCGTCATACGTCDTYCGTCDPYCCCSCSCC
jgi:hypothetical protein